MEWKDRKVLVLGLGDTGLSMTRWLSRQGARVIVADSRAEPSRARTLTDELPEIPLSTGAFRESLVKQADTIAISPGVDRREPLVADALRRGVPVMGDIEMVARALSERAHRNSTSMPKIVAITGSNGKSTVTAMTGEASRAAGMKTVVAGNIGLPVLDALTEIEKGTAMPEVFALELSSFQLESTSSLNADAASVLNITGDHLDRYHGLTDYAAAKARIFEGARTQVLNRMDQRSMSMARAGLDVMTLGTDAPRSDREWGITSDSMLAHGPEKLMPMDELRVKGRHNAANALAALALGHAIGLPSAPMLTGLRRFRGLAHRLEHVADIGGVSFYDDSKGTNVGATVAALNGMTARVALIAGGDGKGQDFSPLAAAVYAHANAVILIGRDAQAIGRVLAACGVPLLRAATLEDAVEMAYDASRPGDAVLLSPACASYDMFKSYVHRGEVFVDAVRALAAREGVMEPGARDF